MTGETVLWYCPDPILAQKAGKVFLAQRLRVKRAGAGETGEQVGALLGLKGYGPLTGAAPLSPPPGEPILVFCGLSSARLDALLAALRKAGVPPIPCKAVLTPDNGSWTLGALYEELRREHEAMHGN